MMTTIQERQNSKIIEFAQANFSRETHEYGRDDMKGKIANKQGERVDPSRYNQDLDKDGRKGVDCSSLVYYSLEGAGFNLQKKVTEFSTYTLFNGKNLTDYAKRNFDFLPSSSKTDGSLKAGDLLLMTMPGNAQHIVIFKEYDEKGRIHFFGSQTSTGPAEVILTGNAYWDKQTVFHGALRPKENFIKPEFHLKDYSLQSVDIGKPVSKAQDMVNQLFAAYTSGDKENALSSVVTNHGYVQQHNEMVATTQLAQQQKEAEQQAKAQELAQIEESKQKMVRS